MRPRHLSIALILASALALQAPAAVIYKWTDADGVVHFSDQPQPGAEKIITKTTNLSHYSQIPAARGTAPARPAAGASVQDYAAFEIDAPQADQTFNESTVTVRLHLQPALKPNHSISLYLNGKLLENQPTDSVIFTLTDLDRGSYTLNASVSDQVSGDSRSTATVTFYVHQTGVLSPLSPLRKKAS
jgi:Domain of unknown function (DUF4124)